MEMEDYAVEQVNNTWSVLDNVLDFRLLWLVNLILLSIL